MKSLTKLKYEFLKENIIKVKEADYRFRFYPFYGIYFSGYIFINGNFYVYYKDDDSFEFDESLNWNFYYYVYNFNERKRLKLKDILKYKKFNMRNFSEISNIEFIKDYFKHYKKRSLIKKIISLIF